MTEAEVVYQPDYVPTNFNRGILLASTILRGHIVVYGFTFTNTNAAIRFCQVFDSEVVPADGTVPLLSKSCPLQDAVGFSWAPQGREFLAGLVLCNSTTQGTKTLGSVDSLFDVQYDVISDAGTFVSSES